jgi:hypothetical protein
MKTTGQLTVAAIVLLAGLGCGTRPPPGLLNEAGVPHDAGTDSTGVCQHTCTRDPGPSPMTATQCAEAEANYEFWAPKIWDFEAPPPANRATAMYSYTDNTEPIASFFNFNTNTARVEKFTWEPFTSVMPRCGNPDNRVIHVQGGPFLAWGGGIGTSFQYHLTATSRKPSTATDVPSSVLAKLTDVSDWDGISFWARRGPDSQVGFRVMAGDKYTDDDVSYLMHKDAPELPRFCERVRECACLNHMECTVAAAIPGTCQQSDGQTPVAATFCGAPEPLASGDVSTGFVQCNTCNRNRCNERYPAFPDDTAMGLMNTDVQFVNRPCTPYTYRNGVTSSFCYDPAAGETVAEPDEQCGDHWTKTVALTNEWQFFTVPFSSMIQQGWAKKFAALDLTALSLIRFSWDGGWVDYYIDDVTFYRHKR